MYIACPARLFRLTVTLVIRYQVHHRFNWEDGEEVYVTIAYPDSEDVLADATYPTGDEAVEWVLHWMHEQSREMPSLVSLLFIMLPLLITSHLQLRLATHHCHIK